MSDIITENRLRKIDFFQKIENIRPDIRLVLFIFRRIRLQYKYCGFFFVVVATFDGKGKKVYNESVKNIRQNVWRDGKKCSMCDCARPL